MSKKSCQPPRIPLEYKGIQVNCCKSPSCENFGLTPEKASRTEIYLKTNKDTDERQVREKDPFYTISGAPSGISTIKCKACERDKRDGDEARQVYYILKSNKAVHEELTRISSYLESPAEQCPNTDCPSNTGDTEKSIKKRGKTAAGTQRYLCNHCSTSWTGKPIERPHARTEIDKILFKLLVSKVPFRRMEFVLEMDLRSIKRRIDFLHRQCMAFVAERERRLSKIRRERMYLCTDRQVQKSNWTNRKEKMNCEFYGIGTADLYSGYVLAFNFNYDPDIDPQETEAKAALIGDHELLKHHREYARVWLKSDFEDAKRNASKKPRVAASSLEDAIEQKSLIDSLHDEDKSSEYFDNTKQVPIKGMEVHNEYTMAAHFYLLKKLLSSVQKTRFYLDQDAGMKTWYIAAFKQEIEEGNSDGFLVTMQKDLTVDMKRQVANEAKQEIGKFAGISYESMTAVEVTYHVRNMVKRNMLNPFITQRTGERWIGIPKPSMSEPSKMIHSFTQIQRYDEEHQANLYLKGGLHAIDRFFMQIRRKVSSFERPFQSGTSRHRIWNGYSPYNPAMYQQLADIFRVFYNYCQQYEKTSETPAMKLGLAKGPVELEKIIYFKKYSD